MSLDWTSDVMDFHEKMSYKNGGHPQSLSPDDFNQRYSYMEEELEEFIDAETLADQADALLDLIYFAIGTLLRMGIDPRVGWDEVHRANMDKVPADAWKHSIKPEDWEPPSPKLLTRALHDGL